MYADSPWTYERRYDGEYYVYTINGVQGHVASVTGWTRYGESCPVTVAHVRLLTLAPDLAQALGDLLAWARAMGAWDAPCWGRAAALQTALRELPPGPR